MSLSDKLFNLLCNIFGKPHRRDVVEAFSSVHLQRDIRFEVFLPPSYGENTHPLPLLLLNDGQDLPRMNFAQILKCTHFWKAAQPFVAVGIYAGDRMQEYGTAHRSDYKNRGSLATQHTRFIIHELLPYLEAHYNVTKNASERALAGFSLGGLSAFDVAWNAPHCFGKVGVFSGALWWRSEAFDPNDPDADRIVHQMVADSPQKPKLQFWFQTGTLDETSDRNNNGIIDAIDDTLDLIIQLKLKGYTDQEIAYLEMEGGKHEPKTWGAAMPNFLKWAFEFGKK